MMILTFFQCQLFLPCFNFTNYGTNSLGSFFPHLATISKLNFYKKVDEADFFNLHDYHCPETRLFGACELAVYDVTEAKYKCDLDKSCKAFVTTGNVLWSGKFPPHFPPLPFLLGGSGEGHRLQFRVSAVYCCIPAYFCDCLR